MTQPLIKENNVRLVGVGLESIGVEEFIEGKFFDGGEEFVNLIELFPDSY